jgi:aspartyl-tRNA(Asn)/glutamyl-tRNA(Gln) amidotransferase subunit B
MPVLNEEAVRLICITGMMLNGEVQRYSKFDRKNYFYPDQAKNYQITQYDLPFCLGGELQVQMENGPKTFRIHRIHLEEDVAKSIHTGTNSLVDFNRAGTPLMEIVTEPDFAQADEVMAFLHALKQILVYGNISDANLEEGNLRCDVNSSVRPINQEALGTKTEIKNMNTFKGIHRAVSYEVARQISVLEEGGSITQETRRWDDDLGRTEGMRSKEDAHDYRYFPEPDLLPVNLTSEQIESWRKVIPELPEARKQRFISDYQLPEYDAGVLVAEQSVADYFEEAVKAADQPKAVSNWVMTEILRVIAEETCAVTDLKVTPIHLAELVKLVDRKTINSSTAKEVFAASLASGEMPAAIVERQGLAQVSDSGALDQFVKDAIEGNPKSVQDYREGKTAALQFLVGQVMKASRGKANPQGVMQALRTQLDP